MPGPRQDDLDGKEGGWIDAYITTPDRVPSELDARQLRRARRRALTA
ncbi:DUF6284 family protein [Streptomyces luteolifulvus]